MGGEAVMIEWVPEDGPDPEKPTTISPNIYTSVSCPACSAEIIGVTAVGDFSICIACRAIVILDVEWVILHDPVRGKRGVVNDVFLRRPTDDEEMRALHSPAVQHFIGLVARHHERHGSPHPDISPPDDH